MTKLGKCALEVILVAALVLAGGEVACAQGSLATGTEADAGGIRVVERAGDHDAAFVLRSVGTGLAVLGVATLAVEGVWAAAAFCFLEPDCSSRPDPPPAELTWAALGAIGGGLVMALVGVLLEVATPDGPDRTRISARPWLHVDDTGGAGGVSIDL